VLYADAAPQNCSGIVTFHKPGTDLAVLNQTLIEGGVQISLRADRKGQQYLRVSPHFYNTDEELERMLQLL